VKHDNTQVMTHLKKKTHQAGPLVLRHALSKAFNHLQNVSCKFPIPGELGDGFRGKCMAPETAVKGQKEFKWCLPPGQTCMRIL
jgi:hypothetical protein